MLKDAMLSEVATAAESGPEALRALSLPRSQEFVTNSRGQRLHVRTQGCCSKGLDPVKGIVIYVHGVGAHCSRPNFTALSTAFRERMGYHFAALDFHGHGYSEGDKGLVSSHDHLLNDVSSFLTVLYRHADADADAPTTNFKVNLPPLDPVTCPVTLLGNSMGGGVSLLFAHLCCSSSSSSSEDRYMSACRGCILSAPALLVSKPPPVVLALLDWVVAPLFPTSPVPPIFSTLKSEMIWESDDYIAYVKADDVLSNTSPIMFKTAQSIVRLCDQVQETLPLLSKDYKMRILVMHDPDDKVCLFQGVEQLQELAPLAATGAVKVVPMPGGRHDLLTNRIDEATEIIAQWMKSNIE